MSAHCYRCGCARHECECRPLVPAVEVFARLRAAIAPVEGECLRCGCIGCATCQIELAVPSRDMRRDT